MIQKLETYIDMFKLPMTSLRVPQASLPPPFMSPAIAPVVAKKWSLLMKDSPNTLLSEFMKMKSHLNMEIHKLSMMQNVLSVISFRLVLN